MVQQKLTGCLKRIVYKYRLIKYITHRLKQSLIHNALVASKNIEVLHFFKVVNSLKQQHNIAMAEGADKHFFLNFTGIGISFCNIFVYMVNWNVFLCLTSTLRRLNIELFIFYLSC